MLYSPYSSMIDKLISSIFWSQKKSLNPYLVFIFAYMNPDTTLSWHVLESAIIVLMPRPKVEKRINDKAFFLFSNVMMYTLQMYPLFVNIILIQCYCTKESFRKECLLQSILIISANNEIHMTIISVLIRLIHYFLFDIP